MGRTDSSMDYLLAQYRMAFGVSATVSEMLVEIADIHYRSRRPGLREPSGRVTKHGSG
jgi:hypothetical protein